MIIAVMMEVLGLNPEPDPAVAKEEESDYRKEKRERQKKSAEEKKRLVEPDDSCGCWYVDSWEEAQAFYRYASVGSEWFDDLPLKGDFDEYWVLG